MARAAVSALLWLVAFVVAAGLGTFQRMTGPTYPFRETVSLGGSELRLSLPRTHGGAGGLEVGVPDAREGLAGAVQWRRYPTSDPWQILAMEPSGGGELAAVIPHQPPAGKVEYRVALAKGGRSVQVPEDEPIVARFRADVPAWVLIPHILAMFGSMMVATRAVLEALRPARPMPRGLVLTAMGLLVVGGLFLGPVVQKYAFDAFWTGWPFGTDLTDNKTALAVLAWLPATVLALRRRRAPMVVAAGWIVMMGVFLIPHSLRGSEIDWSEQSSSSTSIEQTQRPE